MASASTSRPIPKDEYSIRVPKIPNERRYSILKFSGGLGVDVTQWKDATLERENNAAVFGGFGDDAEMPETGAGSEFGRKAREEARRKKMGRYMKKYKVDDQPWLLTTGEKQDKRFRGTREGGITEHADYWLFIKAQDNVFDAVQIKDWYNFLPVARYKTLNDEEAEEKFKQRNHILNKFAIMKATPEEDELTAKTKKSLKLEKGDAGGRAVSDDNDEDGQANSKTGKPIKRNAAARKRRKRESGGSNDERFGSDDSDDGDEEGREVDYMSSESSSDDDVAVQAVKVEKALVGVADEGGLKQMIESDEEDEEEKEEGDVQTTKLEPGDEVDEDEDEDDSKRDVGLFDAPPRPKVEESDSSDSEDFDKEEIKPYILGAVRSSIDEHSESLAAGPSSSSAGPTAAASARMPKSASVAAFATVADSAKDKRVTAKRSKEADDTDSPQTKKAKLNLTNGSSVKGITEDEVRRYLQRKPHSTADLVGKFRGRFKELSKQELVTSLAAILKKLEPEQFKKKDVLYFSLKN